MKLHPLTALRDAVAYGGQFGSFGFFVALGGSAIGLLPLDLAFVLVPLGALVGAGYGVARYLAFEYDLEATTLSIRSGVVLRRAREIPLERVQNVDVAQSFLQRLLGLAVVRFETAGGGSTEGELRLVGADHADELQSELRRHKRETRAAAGAAAAAESEPTQLYELSVGGLAVLAAVSFRWGAVPLALFTTPLVNDLLAAFVRRYVVAGVLGGEVSLRDPKLLGVAVAGVGVLLLTAWAISAVITVTQYWRFRLERVEDELRYERGLVQRYSGSIPLEKVQSLAVEENVAMRRLGYAALTVETAGYAPGGGDGASRTPSAIPLADRGTVLALVAELEAVEDLDVARPPTRARRRFAGRYTIVLLGVAAAFLAVHALVVPLGVLWAVPAAAAVAVVPAAHLKWANLGHRTGDDHVVTRAGVWRRTTRVVPYYRLQTVFTERTVFQRRWDLASVVADTAASSRLGSRDATAHDIDGGDADALHRELVERFRADLARRRARGAARAEREARAADQVAEGPPVDEAPGDGEAGSDQPDDDTSAGGGDDHDSGSSGEVSSSDGGGDPPDGGGGDQENERGAGRRADGRDDGEGKRDGAE